MKYAGYGLFYGTSYLMAELRSPDAHATTTTERAERGGAVTMPLIAWELWARETRSLGLFLMIFLSPLLSFLLLYFSSRRWLGPFVRLSVYRKGQSVTRVVTYPRSAQLIPP